MFTIFKLYYDILTLNFTKLNYHIDINFYDNFMLNILNLIKYLMIFIFNCLMIIIIKFK